MLKDDEGCDLLAKRLGEYHWKLDAAGRVTDVPDETEDDICDAFRYLIMNVFPLKKGRTIAASATSEPQKSNPNQNWMSNAIQNHLQQSGFETIDYESSVNAGKGKKGKLLWDM